MNIEIIKGTKKEKLSIPFLVISNSGTTVLVTEWSADFSTFSGVVLDGGFRNLFRKGHYSQVWSKDLFSPLPSSTKIILSND